MKSIALSFAYTGEEKEMVERRMGAIYEVVGKYSDKVYCNLFDPDVEHYTKPPEFIDEALRKMAGFDVILVIVTSERRSEGLLMEVGAALARGQKIVVAQHESAVGKSYLPEMADVAFVWREEDELLGGIKRAVRDW